MITFEQAREIVDAVERPQFEAREPGLTFYVATDGADLGDEWHVKRGYLEETTTQRPGGLNCLVHKVTGQIRHVQGYDPVLRANWRPVTAKPVAAAS